MFLKRIEMQGFKSFADRTIISFEHPVTGVVGPNGCGKSNIADAVRWVLGEQSAKSMRGEKMNDVIFAGSEDRRKVNMAEVTLVFDNSSHVLNDERDELEVTRRLYRDSGDAEYLINRSNVRLRDVVELFLDTGLGRDSLSIISQGNVVSFAEAKPHERRGIFEEAAGVVAAESFTVEFLSTGLEYPLISILLAREEIFRLSDCFSFPDWALITKLPNLFGLNLTTQESPIFSGSPLNVTTSVSMLTVTFALAGSKLTPMAASVSATLISESTAKRLSDAVASPYIAFMTRA